MAASGKVSQWKKLMSLTLGFEAYILLRPPSHVSRDSTHAVLIKRILLSEGLFGCSPPPNAGVYGFTFLTHLSYQASLCITSISRDHIKCLLGLSLWFTDYDGVWDLGTGTGSNRIDLIRAFPDDGIKATLRSTACFQHKQEDGKVQICVST
jgi:hypothetical protein